MKPHVCFITPAYQRYELSEICFEQRSNAMHDLQIVGIDASCVVIAEDDNLDIAMGYDFHTVERDNEYLGCRFNDGYERACKIGATHVFPIGSDSWCDPQFIIDAFEPNAPADHDDVDLPGDREVISSRHYTRINPTGTRRKQLWVPVWQGVSYLVPAALLAKAGTNRPCRDDIKSGCDGSTWQTLERAGANVFWSESHRFDTVAFESAPQITNFDKMVRYVVSEDETPFEGLDLVYGPALTAQIVDFYSSRRDQVKEEQERKDRRDAAVAVIVNETLNDMKCPSEFRPLGRSMLTQVASRVMTEL